MSFKSSIARQEDAIWAIENPRDRINACVNALAGINPEAVKDVVERLWAAVSLAEEYCESGNPPTLEDFSAFAESARAALAKLKVESK